MRTGIRVHFLYCNMRDTMIIVEMGNLPHPRRSCCDMLMPWAALNGLHPKTAQFTKGTGTGKH